MRLEPANPLHLMDESERCIESAARVGAPPEQLVANRILAEPVAWRRWESEHYAMLREVGRQGRCAAQCWALKLASFKLAQRKALFEYLRDRQLRGEARRRIVQFFHRERSYTDAVLAEHAQYLRSAASFICAAHVGCAVMRDGAFGIPLHRYEAALAEYFYAYCDVEILHPDAATSQALRALLPLLKLRLREQREVILDMPRLAPGLQRPVELQRRSGDTVRIPTFGAQGPQTQRCRMSSPGATLPKNSRKPSQLRSFASPDMSGCSTIPSFAASEGARSSTASGVTG